MDRLHQLFARSLREIEAHASELAETEPGAATIYEAGQLLAALRWWAQSLYRPDEVVGEILESLDASSHCSFADCWGFEQGVLWGW